MQDIINKTLPKGKTKHGFTLVEIMLAIAILLILAVIIIPNVLGYLTRAKVASDDINLASLNNATALYATNKNKTPSDVFAGISSDSNKIALLVSDNYLPSVPVPKQEGAAYEFDTNSGTWTLSGSIAAEPVSNVLYQSDFSSMKNINILKGAWQVINGILSPSKAGENRAILTGTNGTDYSISLTAVLASAKPGSSGYGIYYRSTDTAAITGYCFQYDPGAGNRFVVKKVKNGVESPSFQMVSMAKVMGSGFDISAQHDITISVVGDKHVITVDGVKVMDFADSTFTDGSVGVRSWSDSQVQISDIAVTAN